MFKREYCGIFGVWNSKDAAELIYLGLYALQHRGQESCGIVTSNSKKFFFEKGHGLVNEVFNNKNLKRLKGISGIGHVRYSTAGDFSEKNIQPLVIKHKKTEIAVAHNGNIRYVSKFKKELEEKGSVFQSNSDSEIILQLIIREKGSWEEKIQKTLEKVRGAFSLLFLLPDKIIAVRDSFGFRPLCIGRKQDSYFFSSESCAFDLIDAVYLRDVKHGEMVVIDRTGIKSFFLKKEENKRCIFELIYFSRPDSTVFSQSVYKTRISMGIQLAKEKKIKADLVMPVPDSANVQALGYSYESKIPLKFGFIRNHYIGRTFIEPHQRIRDFRVKIKHSPVKEIIKNKDIILIDDSIVRGTTSKKLIKLLKKAGAKKIHLCISSPPIKFPCFYGIDTPTKKELIANKMSTEEIKKFLEVDSLIYLSREGLLNSCRRMGYCLACFNGKYPL